MTRPDPSDMAYIRALLDLPSPGEDNSRPLQRASPEQVARIKELLARRRVRRDALLVKIHRIRIEIEARTNTEENE